MLIARPYLCYSLHIHIFFVVQISSLTNIPQCPDPLNPAPDSATPSADFPLQKTAFIPDKAKIFDRQRKAVDFFMVVSCYRFCLY